MAYLVELSILEAMTAMETRLPARIQVGVRGSSPARVGTSSVGAMKGARGAHGDP